MKESANKFPIPTKFLSTVGFVLRLEPALKGLASLLESGTTFNGLNSVQSEHTYLHSALKNLSYSALSYFLYTPALPDTYTYIYTQNLK
jgi:hypothetical protein